MSQYHVFSIPASLLETLTPRTLIGEPISQASEELNPSIAQEPQTTANSRACNICLGVTFTDVDAQREHFRSDWHRYNVKLRINGAQPVAEADFAKLVDSKCSDSQRILVLIHGIRPRGLDLGLRVVRRRIRLGLRRRKRIGEQDEA